MREYRFLPFGKTVLTLEKGEDGLWRDDLGTIWDYISPADASLSKDDKVRMGIGWFSIPEAWDINLYAGFHDHAYMSETYQAFHTREEADKVLEAQLQTAGYRVVPEIFYRIVRSVAGWFWENPKTR